MWKPEDIQRHFANHPQGTCGMFRASQLGHYRSSDKINLLLPFKWLAPSLLSASLTLTSNDAVAQPHHNHNVEFNIDEANRTQNENLREHRSTTTQEIRGKVVDSQNQSMPGVNVILKGTTLGTVTNADGEYNLNITSPSPDTLVFAFIGMITQEVSIADKQQIDITLQFDERVLSGVIVVGGAFTTYRWYSPRGWWYRVKGFFRRL